MSFVCLVEVTKGAVDQVSIPEPLPIGSQWDEFIFQKGRDRFGHRLLLRIGPIFMVMVPNAFKLVVVQAQGPLACWKGSAGSGHPAGGQQTGTGEQPGQFEKVAAGEGDG